MRVVAILRGNGPLPAHTLSSTWVMEGARLASLLTCANVLDNSTGTIAREAVLVAFV
jgi:hypothetical protein